MISEIGSPAEPQGRAGDLRRPWALSTPPPFPAAAIRIISILTEEDNVAVKKVVECIQADPVFAAEVLRVANSALFGSRQKIKTIQRAVVILGLDFVKALAITVGMRAYVRTPLRVPVLRSCWNHSVATALLSREFAPACGLKGEEAYTAGLLHDIGRIGLMACYPVEYGNMLSVSYEHSLDLLQCERDVFDLDHCEAGAWLAEEWGLPADIAFAATHHHDVPSSHPFALADLVALSCCLADTLGFSVVGYRRTWSPEEIRDGLPESARDSFDLDLDGLKTRVTAQLDRIT